MDGKTGPETYPQGAADLYVILYHERERERESMLLTLNDDPFLHSSKHYG